MPEKQTAIVICPGRGTYNAAELGYLRQHHSEKKEFISLLNSVREANCQTSISDLDNAEKFRMSLHGTGDNASLLIFGCAIADFIDIQDRYDILAVTGNSMGWYLALTCGGALSHENGTRLVNEMGTLMHEQGQGGQIVYPIVDEEWRASTKRIAIVEHVLAKASKRDDLTVAISIHLGGLVVFAADTPGLRFLSEELPLEDRYPMQLNKHAAFHSSILNHLVPIAQDRLSPDLFKMPDIPLVDGVGKIWTPYSTDVENLYQYTLGAQINKTYNFSRAVEVAVKEFAPDKVIITGPGTTMGAPVAQELIRHNWHGISTKSQFKALQAEDPYIISMGMADQRALGLSQ